MGDLLRERGGGGSRNSVEDVVYLHIPVSVFIRMVCCFSVFF